MRQASCSFDGDCPQNRSEKEGAVSALLQLDVCEAICVSQERLLTDFCGGYCDVVPHVRLPVQWFGQCDLPVLHIDVELPLQVCVSIDEVPAKGNRSSEIGANALSRSSGCKRGPHPTRETCR